MREQACTFGVTSTTKEHRVAHEWSKKQMRFIPTENTTLDLKTNAVLMNDSKFIKKITRKPKLSRYMVFLQRSTDLNQNGFT